MPQERSAGLVLFEIDDRAPIFLLLNYGWGHWGFSKGNIEAGETEKEAAIREAKEETGLNDFKFIDDFNEKIEYFYRKGRKKIHKEVTYFLAETQGREMKLSSEHKGYKWLNTNAALSQLSYNNEKKVLRKASKTIKLFRYG